MKSSSICQVQPEFIEDRKHFILSLSLFSFPFSLLISEAQNEHKSPSIRVPSGSEIPLGSSKQLGSDSAALKWHLGVKSELFP